MCDRRDKSTQRFASGSHCPEPESEPELNSGATLIEDKSRAIPQFTTKVPGEADGGRKGQDKRTSETEINGADQKVSSTDMVNTIREKQDVHNKGDSASLADSVKQRSCPAQRSSGRGNRPD